MQYFFDAPKEAINRQKHKMSLMVGVSVLEDGGYLLQPSPRNGQERYKAIGRNAAGRVLVVVFAPLGTQGRSLISVRIADNAERKVFLEAEEKQELTYAKKQ